MHITFQFSITKQCSRPCNQPRPWERGCLVIYFDKTVFSIKRVQQLCGDNVFFGLSSSKQALFCGHVSLVTSRWTEDLLTQMITIIPRIVFQTKHHTTRRYLRKASGCHAQQTYIVSFLFPKTATAAREVEGSCPPRVDQHRIFK